MTPTNPTPPLVDLGKAFDECPHPNDPGVSDSWHYFTQGWQSATAAQQAGQEGDVVERVVDAIRQAAQCRKQPEDPCPLLDNPEECARVALAAIPPSASQAQVEAMPSDDLARCRAVFDPLYKSDLAPSTFGIEDCDGSDRPWQAMIWSSFLHGWRARDTQATAAKVLAIPPTTGQADQPAVSLKAEFAKQSRRCVQKHGG